MSSADGRVQRGECRLLKADGRVPGADDGDGDGDGDVDSDGDGDCDGDGAPTKHSHPLSTWLQP